MRYLITLVLILLNYLALAQGYTIGLNTRDIGFSKFTLKNERVSTSDTIIETTFKSELSSKLNNLNNSKYEIVIGKINKNSNIDFRLFYNAPTTLQVSNSKGTLFTDSTFKQLNKTWSSKNIFFQIGYGKCMWLNKDFFIVQVELGYHNTFKRRTLEEAIAVRNNDTSYNKITDIVPSTFRVNTGLKLAYNKYVYKNVYLNLSVSTSFLYILNDGTYTRIIEEKLPQQNVKFTTYQEQAKSKELALVSGSSIGLSYYIR
jgi:hypothetical protein